MDPAIETLQAHTVSEFIQATDKAYQANQIVLFRGQAVEKNLVPRIARRDRKIDTIVVERKMFGELKRMGASLFTDGQIKDPWELLVLAQHWGMATRLLDWTTNPLAALWFACSGPENGDSFVYALRADNFSSSEERKKGPFDQPKTQAYKPKYGNSRILAQHGWFTVHVYSQADGLFAKLETIADVKGCLTEIIIPSDSRTKLLAALDRLGINRRTLFPDLGGLCEYLTWKMASGAPHEA